MEVPIESLRPKVMTVIAIIVGLVKQLGLRSDRTLPMKLPRDSSSRAAAPASRASPFLLNRRTRHVPVGAVDAAIAFLGLQCDAAARAVMDVLASVRLHRVRRAEAALWAGYGRTKLGHAGHSFRSAGKPAFREAAANLSTVAIVSSYTTVATFLS